MIIGDGKVVPERAGVFRHRPFDQAAFVVGIDENELLFGRIPEVLPLV